ncbi:MAG: ABC transporter permease [Patulibacter sp.]
MPIAVSLLLLIVLYLIGVLSIDGFGGEQTIRAILLLSTFLGIAAVGQTVVVLGGGIDLSIPFVVGASNVAVAQLSANGMPFGLACVVVIVGAIAIGALNANISVRFNVHPLLVTLGVGTALLGLVQWWTKGLPQGSSPAWLTDLVSIGANFGPLPFAPAVALWLVVAIVVIAGLRWTVFGRSLYVVGNAPAAAELALVSRLSVWTRAFALSGAFSAVAGILMLAFTGTALATVGSDFLFLSIGAVVIGGTAMTGGVGGYAGTVLGTLTLTTLTTVFVGLGLGTSAQQLVLGAAIIGLVAFFGREPHIRVRI